MTRSSSPRLYVPQPLAHGQSLQLPPGPARHVQVLRMQPGQEVTLFNGQGGQWRATIERITRTDVQVLVATHEDVEREPAITVHLAMGMPANERLDWLAEKATELGVASIHPLFTARAIIRLSGDRAVKKAGHWRAVAASACEQSGRNRVPDIAAPVPFEQWIARPAVPGRRFLLSLDEDAPPLSRATLGGQAECVLLSGPEGGLDPREERLALDAGFERVSLGPRVLRAETAPLAALALLSLSPP